MARSLCLRGINVSIIEPNAEELSVPETLNQHRTQQKGKSKRKERAPMEQICENLFRNGMKWETPSSHTCTLRLGQESRRAERHVYFKLFFGHSANLWHDLSVKYVTASTETRANVSSKSPCTEEQCNQTRFRKIY